MPTEVAAEGTGEAAQGALVGVSAQAVFGEAAAVGKQASGLGRSPGSG